MMQKPEIVLLFITKHVQEMWFWRPFFCYATNTYLGSENIGHVEIWPIIMFY